MNANYGNANITANLNGNSGFAENNGAFNNNFNNFGGTNRNFAR